LSGHGCISSKTAIFLSPTTTSFCSFNGYSQKIDIQKTGAWPQGLLPKGFQGDDAYFVHESSVLDDHVKIGRGTKIWYFSHILSGSDIGERCNIGQNVSFGLEVTIGDGCKIQNNVSVYRGVTLEDDVFCGPSMVFTNVSHPRAYVGRMDELRHTLVKKGATLGANSTIICGVTIGRHAFVGAGAVVTQDVPDYALVIGNPGKQVGWVCECGYRLDDEKDCASCGNNYKKQLGDG